MATLASGLASLAGTTSSYDHQQVNPDSDLSDFWTLRVHLTGFNKKWDKDAEAHEEPFRSAFMYLSQHLTHLPISCLIKTLSRKTDVKSKLIKYFPKTDFQKLFSEFEKGQLLNPDGFLSLRYIVTDHRLGKCTAPGEPPLPVHAVQLPAAIIHFSKNTGPEAPDAAVIGLPNKHPSQTFLRTEVVLQFVSSQDSRTSVTTPGVFTLVADTFDKAIETNEATLSSSSQAKSSEGTGPGPTANDYLTEMVHMLCCKLLAEGLEFTQNPEKPAILSSLHSSCASSSGPEMNWFGSSDTFYNSRNKGHQKNLVSALSRKYVGDVALLMSRPLQALHQYNGALDILRPTYPDNYIFAGLLEAEAAALRLYDVHYLESDVGRFVAKKAAQAQSTGRIVSPFQIGTQQELSIPLPVEIERISSDAPKKWGFAGAMGGLLGAAGPVGTGDNVAPTDFTAGNRVIRQTAPDIFVDRRTDKMYRRTVPNRPMIIDLIVNKMREAFQLYSKSEPSAFVHLATECSIRHARLLALLGERTECYHVLERLASGSELKGRIIDQINVLLGCASVCVALQAQRHFAYYILRAAMKAMAQDNLLYLARILLQMSSPWYFPSVLNSVVDNSLTGKLDTDDLELLEQNLRKFYGLQNFGLGLCILRFVAHTKKKSDSKLVLPFSAIPGSANHVVAYHQPNTELQQEGENKFRREEDFRQPFSSDACTSSSLWTSHWKKLALKSTYKSHVTLRWPAIQGMILDALRKIADKLNDCTSSLYLNMFLLSLVHPVLDPRAQALILHRLNSRTPRSQSVIYGPPSITMRKPAVSSRKSEAHNSNHSCFTHCEILGGPGRGMLPPIPQLVNLEIGNRATWQKRGKHLAIDIVRRVPLPLPHDKLLVGSNSTPKSPEHVAGSIFLFNPWADSTSVGSQRKKVQPVEPSDGWVTGELQTVRATLYNCLAVDVALDSLELLCGGSPAETHPVTVLLPPGLSTLDLNVITHTQPTAQQGELYIYGVRCQLSRSNIVCLLLNDNPTLQEYLQEAAGNPTDGIKIEDEAILMKTIYVLQKSAAVAVDVFSKAPRLIHRLQRATTISAWSTNQFLKTTTVAGGSYMQSTCGEPDSSFSALGNTLMKRHRRSLMDPLSRSFQDTQLPKTVYVDFDPAKDEQLCEGEQADLVISLSDVSSAIRATKFRLALLCEPNITCTDWALRISETSDMNAFFEATQQIDDALSSDGELNTRITDQDTTEPAAFPLDVLRQSTHSDGVEIGEVDTAFITPPSQQVFSFWFTKNKALQDGVQSSECPYLIHYITPQHIVVERLKDNPPDVLRIPISYSATLELTDAVCLVEYVADFISAGSKPALTEEPSALYVRYMAIPLSISMKPGARVYVRAETVKIIPMETFDVVHLLEQTPRIFSVDLQTRLDALRHCLKRSTGPINQGEARSSLSHNYALLLLDVVNEGEFPIECFVGVKGTRKANSLRAAPRAFTVCSPGGTVRWMIPVRRGIDETAPVAQNTPISSDRHKDNREKNLTLGPGLDGRFRHVGSLLDRLLWRDGNVVRPLHFRKKIKENVRTANGKDDGNHNQQASHSSESIVDRTTKLKCLFDDARSVACLQAPLVTFGCSVEPLNRAANDVGDHREGVVKVAVGIAVDIRITLKFSEAASRTGVFDGGIAFIVPCRDFEGVDFISATPLERKFLFSDPDAENTEPAVNSKTYIPRLVLCRPGKHRFYVGVLLTHFNKDVRAKRPKLRKFNPATANRPDELIWMPQPIVLDGQLE